MRTNTDPKAQAGNVTFTAVACSGEEDGSSISTVALVRDPRANGQRKDGKFAFGEFGLRVFLAGEQEHTALVGPHESDRDAVVSGLSVLPNEPAEPPDGSNDAGSDADRRCRQDPYRG